MNIISKQAVTSASNTIREANHKYRNNMYLIKKLKCNKIMKHLSK